MDPLELLLHLGSQARSLDELAMLAAQYMEPPALPPTPQMPQQMVPQAAPAPAPVGQAPNVAPPPQTRGEAATSVGSLLGGY